MIEEGLFFIVPVVLVIIFCGVVVNEPFWQGYRNSKFLDELKKSEKDWQSFEQELMK